MQEGKSGVRRPARGGRGRGREEARKRPAADGKTAAAARSAEIGAQGGAADVQVANWSS